VTRGDGGLPHPKLPLDLVPCRRPRGIEQTPGAKRFGCSSGLLPQNIKRVALARTSAVEGPHAALHLRHRRLSQDTCDWAIPDELEGPRRCQNRIESAADDDPLDRRARNAPSSALRDLTTSISLRVGGVGKTLENLGNER
jgi:hypothetical protein